MKLTNTPEMEDDFGDFQPFFFEDNFEETLYDLDIPAPSEDIWKKFELLPTPPRSPKHEPVDDLLDLDIDAQMQLVSQILEDDPLCHAVLFPDLHNCSDCQTQKSVMDQECMWSTIDGFGLTTDKNTVSQKCSKNTNSSLSSVCLSNSVDIKSSECVDPTAVFPYPLATPSKPQVSVKSEPEPVITQHSLGIETPSDSEESSDSDNDDDEEDEEEIDVVTVGQTLVPSTSSQATTNAAAERVRRISTEPMPRAASMSAQVAAMHNYTQPRPPVSAAASAVASTHSYASLHTTIAGHKRSRAVLASSSSSHHGSSKRVKLSLPNGNADLRSVVQKLKHVSSHRSSNSHGHHSNHTSRSSSDSEDCDKRAQHNVLERKRRNDLKSSFMVLRDQVPDLLAQERAAKVVILKKASEHIKSLRSQERTLDIELNHQKRKHEQLKQKLALLQRL